ncbi:hypothetical protein MYSTI_06316 [Myxococcus stipitatus DSM 14675]|uniref:Uncharacterized protein n=1 Tax=Myxococcus stipitatus (strain DSM 14675 / JCM 12634 / Mx s8) TaxID=1278073 RepID=L7UM83_MYXSD|nr:hypothetical protein [Myxococcus stipitatus]AGC47589.1 hypothetical protein MYSTI_06316 [Myxococcus stipitatus DSM 14675]
MMQQAKKRSALTNPAHHGPEASRKSVRPVGMQEMGPGLYEQIRRALSELTPASTGT